MRLKGFLDIPILVQYAGKDINDPQKINDVYVQTNFGQIPLRTIASVDTSLDQPFITREKLRNTIDVTGGNSIYTIAQVSGMAQKKVSNG